MPYNNSAIPPSGEVSGTATLPLARIKKILSFDDENGPVSANAAFAITIATEEFIRYLADRAHDVSKSGKKARHTVTYNDAAEAVNRVDQLQFLEDLVPKTTTHGEHKAKMAAKGKKIPGMEKGQSTLDGTRESVTIADQALRPDPQMEVQQNDHAKRLVFEHYEPTAPVAAADQDVEMQEEGP